MIYKSSIDKHIRKIFWIKNKLLIHGVVITAILLCAYFKVINTLSFAVLLFICFMLLYNYLVQSEILKYICTQIDIIDENFSNNNLPTKQYLMHLLLDESPVVAYYINNNNEIQYKNKMAKSFFENYNIDDIDNDINIKEATTIKQSLKDTNNIIKDFKIYKYPLTNNKSQSIGLCTIVQDISLETKIKQQHEMYIAIIMHDLKTPVLAQVRSLTNLLKKKDNLTSEQQELIELILESSNWVYKMLTIFLDICKFEEDKEHLILEQYSLDTIIKTSSNELSTACSEKNVELHIDNSNNIKHLLGDKTHLIFIFNSLLKLSVSSAYSNSDINIVLKDTQAGINVEIESVGPAFNSSLLENLLQENITNASKHNRVGEGLELYLSQQIIKAHNGTVSVNIEQDTNKRYINIAFGAPIEYVNKQMDNKYFNY